MLVSLTPHTACVHQICSDPYTSGAVTATFRTAEQHHGLCILVTKVHTSRLLCTLCKAAAHTEVRHVVSASSRGCCLWSQGLGVPGKDTQGCTPVCRRLPAGQHSVCLHTGIWLCKSWPHAWNDWSIFLTSDKISGKKKKKRCFLTQAQSTNDTFL